jgi:hypothetical protein
MDISSDAFQRDLFQVTNRTLFSKTASTISKNLIVITVQELLGRLEYAEEACTVRLKIYESK